MPQVLLGLGSNVGDRLSHLRQAVEALSQVLDLQAASRVYETAPMYVEDQGAFYNAALLAATELSPLTLLKRLKGVESEIGRAKGVRYGPREIDIDLLAYGVLRYRYSCKDQKKLEVPHVRMTERRFVLAPLSDIAPQFLLPGLGVVCELLLRTNEQAESVKAVEDAVLPIHRQR